jgi:hypothetical protein
MIVGTAAPLPAPNTEKETFAMSSATTRSLASIRTPLRFRLNRKVLLAFLLCFGPFQLLPLVAEAALSVPPGRRNVPPAIGYIIGAPETEPIFTRKRLVLPPASTRTIACIQSGDLQLGFTGQVLLSPLCVRVPPGSWVHFQAFPQGRFVEFGASDTWVVAGDDGIAQVHFRLGEVSGRYIVRVTPMNDPRADLFFELFAFSPGEAPTR